jgi:hypothetical protein
MSTSDREGVVEKHGRKVFDSLACNDPEDGDFGRSLLVFKALAVTTN